MGDLILGVGEFAATDAPGTFLKTYALGSCVAVVLFDSVTGVAGMVHVALPDSSINPAKGAAMPGYFADTGITALFSAMADLGSYETNRGMVVKLMGGASIISNNEIFNIGKRNQVAIKKHLLERGLTATAEDLGGNYSRTVTVSVDNGSVSIACPGRGQWQV